MFRLDVNHSLVTQHWLWNFLLAGCIEAADNDKSLKAIFDTTNCRMKPTALKAFSHDIESLPVISYKQ